MAAVLRPACSTSSSACSAARWSGLIAAFPKELVLAVAGFALLGTIGSGLATAMKDESQREAALITFLVTASGLALWGVGSAFWGVVAGALALVVQHWQRPALRMAPALRTMQP